ncbi:hypothetical protein CORC01_13548 [Colletotrichum orchidophilum]|uniref:Uncharacterized protein n=1 Tax=Colletotrichum orchidophilum TaxID=1209926 RepID=A0A1G4APQ1_9PEZI|nr:uncharacterized protein CORC01_13548 [Colletotrichum orchidophilum]OHE91137.1 hypothetical protein CORC01_13548 [Colletotrichum orchidophilum]
MSCLSIAENLHHQVLEASLSIFPPSGSGNVSAAAAETTAMSGRKGKLDDFLRLHISLVRQCLSSTPSGKDKEEADAQLSWPSSSSAAPRFLSLIATQPRETIAQVHPRTKPRIAVFFTTVLSSSVLSPSAFFALPVFSPVVASALVSSSIHPTSILFTSSINHHRNHVFPVTKNSVPPTSTTTSNPSTISTSSSNPLNSSSYPNNSLSTGNPNTNTTKPINNNLTNNQNSGFGNSLPMPGLSGPANGPIGNLLKGPVDDNGKLKDAGLMVGIKLDLEAEVHLTARVRGDILVGLY